MMRVSFRAKLMMIVGSAALAFLVILIVSTVTASRVTAQLTAIQDRHLPKIDLETRLEAQFEQLRRAFQDAVAAHDSDALERTRSTEDALLAQLEAAREVITPADLAALRAAIEDYYAAAHDVSRRIIAGETGEPIVESMALMQAKLARTRELVKTTTRFDRGELTEAFVATRRAQAGAAQLRLVVVVACLAFVLGLSLWLSRRTIASLELLATGLSRFGKGDFEKTIEVTTRDELGDLADHANAMARSLARVHDERERTAWLKTGQAGLADELRGELEPEEVARRATAFVARHIDAPAAAVYVVAPDGTLRLFGRYAFSPAEGETTEAPPSFRPGEGLVGQASLVTTITVVTDPPAGYLRVRSGLGEAAPTAIVLLPLVHEGKVTGVMELALFKPWSERAAELLLSVREAIAIAVEVARARTAMRQLLAETQKQAVRLATQEERLRATNEELESQQEELRQMNEELTRQTGTLGAQRRGLETKNVELEDARRRLEEKAAELTTVSAYKSQFLANMSHELRTPLNSMLLLSQLLAENETGNLTEKQVEFAKTVYGAGNDLLSLINEVLDLAKVEAGKQELRVQAVSLRDVADHARRAFGPLANRKGLTLTVDVAAGLPETIATDRQRLTQIVNNLVANAIKFTERGEVALRIASAEEERSVAFVVADTGVGIAPEHRERVFAPFEQVEASSDRRYGGTGLGLTIARQLASLLGGELQLASVLGKGSTFTCRLPLDGPPHPSSVPPAAPAKRTAAPVIGIEASSVDDDRAVVQPGDAHLLVIEDDRVFGAALGDIIRSYGMRYIQELDAAGGLRSARERRPTGIILDVMLPDIDGWRVMDQLRGDAALASIPVHFVSAVDGADRGLSLGAVGYLTKPASRGELAQVVETLGSRREGTRRLLVVDQPDGATHALVRELESETIEARRAGGAAEALELLANDRFDCVILDLDVPGMDGLDLLTSLQAREGVPSIVVYTGRPLSKPEARRLEEFADAVVLKDGSSTERLLDEIRLFLQRLQQGLGNRRTVPERLHGLDARFAGKKVLLVDDDMRTVYALSAALRAKGLTVIVADTGHGALAALDGRSDVAAVLMDIMMPEMDGYEATRRIRKIPRFEKLPIIALTAKAMKGDRAKCLEVGASDYLEKPVDVARLLAMLNGWLARTP